MKRYQLSLTLSLTLVLSTITIWGQSPDFTQFKDIEARNIGPAGMSGRVTAIDVDMSNTERIFIGTASGGVWLSENGGISWHPIFDKTGIQSIGALKINQSNPSEIWVGTGEGNPRNSQNSGAGVFKSIDGGKNWKFIGLKNTRVIHRIAIDESRDGVVYIGAQGAAWGPSEDRGVFKTTNGGETWEKILYINDETGVGDMVMDPDNPNKLIVAMWEFGRKPWTFNSGGMGSGIHITYDGGKHWKEVDDENGLPKGILGRCGLAIAGSNPNVVYALVEAKENALFRSSDGGENWREVSTDENMGNRPFYYSEIYVDPTNENRVYSLWSYVSMSEDGGRTFDVIADYGNSVHPDHHAFWINSQDPSHLIDGNDGGLNISNDMGKNWRFVNNLPVGQFYHVNVDNDFPYNVYGGMQDNGSWVGPAFVLKSGGITNHDWQEVYFGDGFDVAPHPEDSDLVYAMSQGGNLGLVNKKTGEGSFIKPNNRDTVRLRFNWNAPLALDPFNSCGLYYGSQFVHYSTDCGNSWTIISPDLTTNDTSKQHQDRSGGLTIDATNAENNTTIISIAPSPQDAEVIWVGTDDGRLQLSKDGGSSWADLYSNLPDAPEGGWIPQIETSSRNSGESFVVVNNYRQNDWDPYLYHTTDFGVTWTRLVNSEDISGFTTSILQDREEPNLLFLGADDGLYISVDHGENWTKWENGFPSVQVRDIKIQENFDDLVLGTFGRAFWVIDEIGPFRALAMGDYTESDFKCISASPGYLSESRSYQGIRFYAQGEFIGDNKDTDVQMSFWINPEESDGEETASSEGTDDQPPKKKKEDNKLQLHVIDMIGDTVRQFSREINDKGLVRIDWRMEVNGVRGPSRRAPRGGADLPSGGPALPGEYKVIAQFGGHIDSMMVDVRLDPRLDVTKEQMMEMKEARREVEEIFEIAAAGYDKIREAKESLSLIEKLTETLQDSTQTAIGKLNKEQNEKLDELEHLFFNREGLKGIQRNPDILTATLFGARRYLPSYGKPGPNASISVHKAKEATEMVMKKVNEYFDEVWPAYKSQIEELEFKIFD